MSGIDKRLKRVEERLDRIDPPPRFASVEEYAEWRDSHGGGTASSMVIGAGRSALNRLKGGALPGEVEELQRQLMDAVKVEERLRKAKK